MSTGAGLTKSTMDNNCLIEMVHNGMEFLIEFASACILHFIRLVSTATNISRYCRSYALHSNN